MKTPQHIAVLLGGWSAEREVSLNSGKAVANACRELGYQVTEIDVAHDIATVLSELKPDACFNALHGKWGEDGCIQGILDVLQIPYTHSGVLASALAMYKPLAKDVFRGAGIPCSGGDVYAKHDVMEGDVMPRPYVVKPLDEGSSVGVHIVMEGDNALPWDDNAWPFGDKVLVEPYVPGREIQVAVLNDKALGAIEIRPKGQFYDYETKYTDGKADHIMPAPLSEADYAKVMEYAERAHKALGCRGLSRSDFRYDNTLDNPEFFILELNTQPGMTPLSLAPEIAAYAGISFAQLVERLIKSATCGN